ncbi:hypothetical protein [Mucilaginibacter sp.]|jgi:hypothetical protein|uniref:hypothetical protein n=1 Tax=Mucilaginibacter sp. TaxID=1882438 RepID=UPI0035664179
MNKYIQEIPCFFFALIIFLLSPTFVNYSLGQTQPQIEREKVHIHFDKPFYAAGDTIWFKAYIVTAGSNRPSSISKVLHVNLIDSYKHIVKNMLLPVDSGLTNGDIILPDTLKGGRYRIYAFTNWMRNFGSDTFFEKEIPVINSGSPEAGPQQKEITRDTAKKMNVQFFPEGGELVAGLRSKVGVKITGYDGLGKNAGGDVIDQNGHIVASFHTTHAGIGAFPLTPAAGSFYKAVITTPGKGEMCIPLPEVRLHGYVLTVNNRESDSVHVNIANNNTTGQEEIILTAQGDWLVYYSVKITAEKGRCKASIPRKYLPAGVIRLTLSSAQNIPVAERLIFNDDAKDLQLKISSAKEEYSPSEKITLDFSSVDEGGKPLPGNYSVAVTSVTKVPENEEAESTIQSNLLLASDVKGCIEHPSYYFLAWTKADSNERALHLDNLLLTQGWRRFIWKKIATDSTGLPFAPENGLQISGKLLTKTKSPVIKSKIYAFANSGGMPVLLNTVTTNDGSFKFSDLDFDDPTSFAIQTKDVKNKNNVAIFLNTVPEPELTAFDSLVRDSLIETDYTVANEKRNNEMTTNHISNNVRQLKEVIVKSKKQAYSSTVLGRNFAYNVIDNKKIKGESSLKYIIEKYNPFIRFNKENQPKYIGRRPFFPEYFVTMIDGALTDNDILQSMNPDEIESIEIHTNGLGVGVLDKGVIVINTKRRDPNHNFRKDAVSGMSTFLVKGYYRSREFYNPTDKVKQEKPDLRDVVYWNPKVSTEQDGKASLTFFNADSKGLYRVVVEGVSFDGRLGRFIYTYLVK